MEFQSSLRPDGAPAPRDAVICFPSLEDSPGSLTKEHQPDVSNPYGPGTVDPRDRSLTPLSTPLQGGFGFFRRWLHIAPPIVGVTGCAFIFVVRSIAPDISIAVVVRLRTSCAKSRLTFLFVVKLGVWRCTHTLQ
jgi:hypothetical protein